MKTLKCLEEMKEKKMIPFGNQYDYFFAMLEDYYISKLNGLDRIKAELENWDKEAQRFIVNELADMITKNGIMYFDRNEIISLVK